MSVIAIIYLYVSTVNQLQQIVLIIFGEDFQFVIINKKIYIIIFLDWLLKSIDIFCFENEPEFSKRKCVILATIRNLFKSF